MNIANSNPNSRAFGGLRSRNQFKEGEKDKPLITVITVVLNDEKGIESTLNSILNQTYPHLELIVIDGKSTDSTLSIIQSFDSKIDYWISEKDAGIYDAMNKGIELARGEWISFMNSGDQFFSNSTLSNVFENRDLGKSTVIHGDWEVRYGGFKKRMVESGVADKLWKGSQFCHQAVFIKADYHKANLYSAKNKIVADFEFFYHTWKRGEEFLKISEPIASIAAGGISDLKRTAVIKAWWSVVDGSAKHSLYFSLRYLREAVVMAIKRIVG